MKIENMREQHTNIVGETHTVLKQEIPSKTKERQEYGIVAVSMGSGIADLFKSIGANSIIEGGQTMNPSTEDIVNAIKDVHAKNVIVLPNNKNIIMAAEQAAEVSGENVIVIPSKTVPQGMSALLAFNPVQILLTNKKHMTDAFAHVKTGQITFAVRDTVIDGLAIEKDDFMGILDGKIVVKNKDKRETASNLLEKMIDEDSEIVTILKGEDATDEDVDALVTLLEEQFQDVEVEVHNGNQPLYAFIISVE